MQPDQDEHQAVDGEGEGIPKAVGLQTHAGREQLRLAASEIEAAGYDRENAGSVHRLCGQIGGVGNHDAENDFDGAIVEIALDALDDEGDEKTDGQADDDKVGEAEETCGDGRSFSLDDHGNAKFQGQQSGGVVDQAFPFDHVDDALR